MLTLREGSGRRRDNSWARALSTFSRLVRGQALVQALRVGLDCGGLPVQRGERPHVTVTISLADLLTDLGDLGYPGFRSGGDPGDLADLVTDDLINDLKGRLEEVSPITWSDSRFGKDVIRATTVRVRFPRRRAHPGPARPGRC